LAAARPPRRYTVPTRTKHLANEARRLADVLVDDARSDDFQKVGVDVGGNRLCQQGLAGARRAVEEHALGRLDADPQEQLRVEQRELDDLANLADLLAQAADRVVRHVAGVLDRHVVHERVDLARQLQGTTGAKGCQRKVSRELGTAARRTAAAPSA